MKGINQATNPCIQSPSDHPQEKNIQRETNTITGARDQYEDYPQEHEPKYFNIQLSVLRIRIHIGNKDPDP